MSISPENDQHVCLAGTSFPTYAAGKTTEECVKFAYSCTGAECGSFDGAPGAGVAVVAACCSRGRTRIEVTLYSEVFELPYYAVFVSLWSVFMLEFWKRKQARLALRWGTIGFEKREQPRVEFRPTHAPPRP